MNERTHILDASNTAIEADIYGKCSIVARTDESLACSKYEIVLTQYTPTESPVLIHVEPAQRVIRGLGNIKTSSDIQDATSTAGVSVFKSHTADEGDFKLAAAALGSFNDMALAIEPDTAQAILGSRPSSADVTVAWQKDSKGKVTKTDHSWIEEAVDGVEHFFGDVLEAYRSALIAVTKIALKVVGPILTIVFEIAGTVIRFVVTHIGPLVRRYVYLSCMFL